MNESMPHMLAVALWGIVTRIAGSGCLCSSHRDESAQFVFAQCLNSKNLKVIFMCESLESRTATDDLPYDLEEPGDERKITDALMKLSEISLHDFLASEPDIYKDDDLKVRYR
jgi:hypothetical protein